jgi:cell division protease FtsH
MTKRPIAPPPGDKPMPTAPPPPPRWRHWLWPAALVVTFFLYFILPGLHAEKQVTLSYSQFITNANQHKVKDVVFGSSNGGANTTVTGTLKNGQQYTTEIPGSPTTALSDKLAADGITDIKANPAPSGGWANLLSLLVLLLPIIFVFYLFRRMSKGAGSPLQGVLGVGRSKAKVFDAERPSTKFTDVAGYEGAKAEIAEVVDFLRNPDRYKRAGAMAPRGVLMVGPPGTGKTLLARAVAGEAAVPFFSVTGSSFVEMFVGVGAARVRDLFTEARKRAPAIIFVDEIDAIGQRRGGSGVVANDEREQTLNQLLAEMDGFDITQGIVVLGATNRPEVLDPALLRPGRFDRQVIIPLPTLSERASILEVHVRGKQLAPDVDLSIVARGTPGFSGADLANLANEAAIFAVRDNREIITAADFSAARDRILLGRREGSNVLLPEEKNAVAIHEAGHALVAVLSEHADPVAKVTILPAGQALGVTEQLPLVERHLYGEDYLTASLAVRLGGRAAELVELGQGSTGASNDLASATDLATRMVREFGLSPALGPVGYPEGGSVFLGGGGSPMSSRPFAEATQAIIDAEVARLLREAEQTAVALIRGHRDELAAVVGLLLEKETVDGDEVYRIAGRVMPENRPTGEAMAIAPHRAAESATPVGATSTAATSTTAANGSGQPGGPAAPGTGNPGAGHGEQ